MLLYPALELIPSFPVPKLWKREYWRVLRSARSGERDVFVSHTRFFLSSFLALLHARAKRKPLLHIEHGSDYVQLDERRFSLIARAYDHTLGKILLDSADQVAAGSTPPRSSSSNSPAARPRSCTEGCGYTIWTRPPHTRGCCGAQTARRSAVPAGRINDGKGVPDLLRAFASADDENALLCIVGDGPRRGDLAKLLAEQLGIPQSVAFLGYLSEDETHRVVRASDVIVNPSYTEGLPTSVFEGALMRKAVLASDVGGTAEIITESIADCSTTRGTFRGCNGAWRGCSRTRSCARDWATPPTRTPLRAFIGVKIRRISPRSSRSWRGERKKRTLGGGIS